LIPQERNIKISIDDAALKKLVQTVDEAAGRILRNGMNAHWTAQNSLPNGEGIFDTAGGLLKNPLTANQKENKTEEEKFTELTKKMLGNFESMLAATQKMLQNTGLMNTEFGKIIQMIMQFVNSFGKAFDFGKSVIGFISDLFLPGSGTLFNLMPGNNSVPGSLSGTTNTVNRVLPLSNDSVRTIYVIPRDSIIRGRDIHQSWSIEEKIVSESTL